MIFVSVAPLVTSMQDEPAREQLLTRNRSGLKSKRGTFAGAGPDGYGVGTGSGTSMPGSRTGRATPGITPEKTPFDVEVAFASLIVPWVGATTVNEFTCSRMP